MDPHVVERAQAGDKAAFATLVAQSIDRLHAIAHHILRDPDLASDATQQALLDVWRRLPQLRDLDRFEAWTYRIVVRAAYAEARRRAAWRLRATTIVPNGRTADAERAVDDHDELEQGFRHLSTDHRAVIVLKHYLGLSDPEVAEVLEISEGTVRSRHFHAMRALRAALDAAARPVAHPSMRGKG